MSDLPESLIVYTTAPRAEIAADLARELVERELAACVQIVGPIQSVYRWKGAVESAPEWLCLIKTTRERFPALEAAIRTLHPYETPELVATPITHGSAAYLQWVVENCGGGAAGM